MGNSKHTRAQRSATVVAIALAGVGGCLLSMATVTTSSAAASPPLSTSLDRPTPPNNGLSYVGLERATTGRCAHGYRVVSTTYCTHGPDSYADSTFYAASNGKGGGSGGGGGKGGPKASPSPTSSASPSPTATTSPSPSPSPTAGTSTSSSGGRCGTDGPRVQAVYAHAADVADAYAGTLPTLEYYLSIVDDTFNNSAAETGGVRHVRFVTDASCTPVVADVTLSTTGDDSFSNTINELKAQGYNRSDRKYLVWVDANVYCGIGTVQQDDSAGSTNLNNSGPSYGRTDRGCWGGTTEAHELMHNLGAVQLSAPHSDGAWHCTDEWDLMCYQENNNVMTYPCGDLSHDNLFDCGHDDYFSTDPLAGSYLASHWNSASSSFLTSSST